MSGERVNKYAVRLANGGVSHVEGESINFGPEWITVASGDDSDRTITAYFRLDQVFAVHVTPLGAPHMELRLGDTITPENMDQLPEDKKFVLVDAQGDSWDCTPSSKDFDLYSPFALIYLHED